MPRAVKKNQACRSYETRIVHPFSNTGTAGVAGANGPAGPVGPMGATGATGPAGAKGDTGAAGAAWAPRAIPVLLVRPGAKGDTGAAGAGAGAKGDTGAAGATGETGAKGDTGPAGAKGDPGMNGTDGKDGMSVTTEDVQPGSAKCPTGGIAVTSIGVLYLCNGLVGPDAGPIGVQGEAGERGALGPIGPVEHAQVHPARPVPRVAPGLGPGPQGAKGGGGCRRPRWCSGCQGRHRCHGACWA